ncbi:hypothetical protein [Edaphobacter modestus]|nr:hypothetical protein [Edaphobacter modestus]
MSTRDLKRIEVLSEVLVGRHTVTEAVSKKSQQVRKQGCNQHPKHRPHGAPPSIPVDISEAQYPGCDLAAEEQANAET